MDSDILKELINVQAHLEVLAEEGRKIQGHLESPEYEKFESQVTRAKYAADKARAVIARAGGSPLYC